MPLDPTASSPRLIPRKRGRPRGTKNKPRKPTRVQRLGLRIGELAAAINTSVSAVKRAIKRGEIETVFVAGCEIVPSPEIKRLGLGQIEPIEEVTEDPPALYSTFGIDGSPTDQSKMLKGGKEVRTLERK